MTVESDVEQVLCEVVSEALMTRHAGHCLKVSHLPLSIADGACSQLHRLLREPDVVCLVTTTPTEAWHAVPTKLVRYRNEAESTGGRVVAFVPAGENLAAEDSFGPSTFEELRVADLYARASRRLQDGLEQVDPELAEVARSVVETLRREDGRSPDDRAVARYLFSLMQEPNVEGGHLEELGLLPDSQLRGAEPAVREARIKRNARIMTNLCELAPPLERIRALPVDVESRQGARLASAVLDSLQDGTVDRYVISSRLARAGRREVADLGSWVNVERAEVPDAFEVLALVGDFEPGPELTARKANASIGIKYRCQPAPADAGIKELTLDIVKVGESLDDLAETGVSWVKRGRSLPGHSTVQWKPRVRVQELEAGLHCFRLRAYSEDNVRVGECLSPPFKVGEEIVEAPSTMRRCASVEASRVEASGMVEGRLTSTRPTISAGDPKKGDEGRSPVSLVLRYEGVAVSWELQVSRLLAKVERYTLDDPPSLGRYGVTLDTADADVHLLEEKPVPERFVAARRELFEGLLAEQYPVEGTDSPGALVALADLRPLESLVRTYLETWVECLRSAVSQDEVRTLLSVDQVVVTNDPEARDLRLVGPTHPLRLFWLLRYQQMLEVWSSGDAAAAEAKDLKRLVSSIYPANIPHLVPGEFGPLHHLEPIDLYWAVYGPPAQADKGALLARIRDFLRLERSTTTTISVEDIVQRIRRYLVAHPYVRVLNLNVVQPGSARLVLDTLLMLQQDVLTSDLRYVVRLFASQLSRNELGRALDDFMSNPEAARVFKKDAVDAFLSSADDPLCPKLTYSKHNVDELLAHPGEFPAHLSFFLDWFDLSTVPAAPPVDRRSFFGEGLLVEPVVVYRSGDGDVNPQWDEFVVADPDAQDPLISAYGNCQVATARLLGAVGAGMVPAVRLELDRVRRSVLDAVHRASDWVVTIDPVFADDYLDSPQAPDATPRYLIDYVSQGALETSRRIMVSTRSKEELGGLLEPELRRHGLAVEPERAALLMDALKLLGAGLPLRLLNNRTQAFEALSLALGSVYLADEGVMRHALVIPLDLHQDLFREGVDWRTEAASDLRRTDLAIVQIDPELRRFVVHLVEVKAREGLPPVTPSALIDDIQEQLKNSQLVLRSRLFGAGVREKGGSLAAMLQVRRLSRMMGQYLERSRRYGLLEAERVAPARRFLATLEEHYSLAFEKHAVIFDLNGESQGPETSGDVRIVRIGRQDILDLLERARTKWPTRVVPTDMDEHVGRVEALVSEGHPVVETVPGTRGSDVDEGEVEPGTGTKDEPVSVESPPDAPGPDPSAVLLVGQAKTSAQFGIIGRIAATERSVALDVDGTNVISVFGVQGSGKSYTVGTLLEAALLGVPGLNRLPNPLAGIVFHYSADQRYVPEFASMSSGNDEPSAIEILGNQYGVSPTGIGDIRILVPEDKLSQRVLEFPGLDVQPMLIGPDELNLGDIKLLVGLEGGDQMYARAMNVIVRQVRGNLSLHSLKKAVGDSATLSQQQKNLALTRIQFAETFVRDGASAASHIKPGRLVIVDLRDELVEEEEALTLFMVLLNRFTQTSTFDGRGFNRMIVFDEAHKYMGNTRLTGAIVNTVREMRHRGTTVILASQNPPSLPRDIIELSSIVIAHKFTSPLWLEHIRRVNLAFGDRSLQPSQLAGLGAGEAFVWASGGAEEFLRPQRVRIRPRLTMHGGGTRRATDR